MKEILFQFFRNIESTVGLAQLAIAIYNCAQHSVSALAFWDCAKDIWAQLMELIRTGQVDSALIESILNYISNNMNGFNTSGCCDAMMAEFGPEFDDEGVCCKDAFIRFMQNNGSYLNRFLINYRCCYSCHLDPHDPDSASGLWTPSWGINPVG